MSADLRDILGRRTLVLDGALGTELTRRGVETPLPLWSAAALRSAPEVVEAIHRDYVLAGADVLVTNTFRTNARTLRAAGLLDEAAELNRLAVQLARRAADAADRPVWVAGSMAPVEDCYAPERVPPFKALVGEHVQMAGWLRDAGVDLLWIETIGTVREALAAVSAAAMVSLPAVVSFVVREDGALLGGEPLARAIEAVESGEPLAIGLNCIPPRGVTALLPRLRSLTHRPLAAYAHIGDAPPIPGWSWAQPAQPGEYAAEALAWRGLGAAIIGGCCGSTPEHVAALASALRG